MNLRALVNRGLAALGFRGHGLVTKSISGIEQTVQKLEAGVEHIKADAAALEAEISAKRRKYNDAQAVRYARRLQLDESKARALRVAGRYAEFIR